MPIPLEKCVLEEYREFLRWLNGTSEEHQAIRDKLKTVITLFRIARGEGNFKARARDIIRERLRRELRKYRYFPRMSPRPPFSIEMFPALEENIFGPYADVECISVWTVMQLDRAGLIHRLRKCERCDAWYLATRAKRRWCTRQCGQNNYRSTPEFKAHRKQYMREYYRHPKAGFSGKRSR